MTAEQIEQKKQQLHQLALEAQAICKELVEAGAIELSDDDLDNVAGGKIAREITVSPLGMKVLRGLGW